MKMIAIQKNETSFFSKNLGRLKEYLQENNKIKGIIDMADQLGSNRNSLRWYISGEQEPSVGFLRKISNLYDVNMDWLLENRGPMFRDVGIENASRIFLQSTETERSIIFTKFKLFHDENRELNQIMATLSPRDLPEDKRIKLESRCIGQLLILQKQRQDLYISMDSIIDRNHVIERSEFRDGHKKEIEKHIKEISGRIRKFTRGKSVEFQAVIDEIVGNL